MTLFKMQVQCYKRGSHLHSHSTARTEIADWWRIVTRALYKTHHLKVARINQYAAALPAALRGSDAAVIVPLLLRATTAWYFQYESKYQA